MQNPFGNLLLQIQERIKSVAPVIREVNEDRGQLESYEIRPAVSFPCVLVDFDFNFTDWGELVQHGDGAVVIRLAFPPFSSASSLMPETVREKALAYTDYELLLHKALHGWQPESITDEEGKAINYGALTRESATTERRNDTIRVRVIRYRQSIEDYTTSTVLDSAEAEPDIIGKLD